MRRKDREVTDFNKIISIIQKSEILRLGLFDENGVYIVPVNYSFEVLSDKTINFYIHGAIAGRKFEIMSKNPVCSFEIDNFIKIDYLPQKKDITTRYESVMGKAKITFIEENQKETVMQEKILTRYKGAKNFEWNKNALSRCSIIKLTVTEISAKANLE